VNPNVPAKTVDELVKATRAKPDQYNYASAGNGTAPHFAAEMFKISTKAELAHVPYKGSAPAMGDTVAGQTQVMFPSLFTAYPFVKAGKLRAMGIAGTKRSSAMPDVPTLEELGIKGVDVTQWYAIFAPAKTPRPIVDKLNTALNAALADKEVAARIESHGAVVDTSTPDKLRQKVRSEVAKWRGVVEMAKLQAD
jgi:tripartite-type tricarboxylate transporter receptor subunit TctC